MTLKTIAIACATIPLIIVCYFFILGYISKSAKPLGILEGRLHPCSEKPNCICSEFLKNEQHYFPPLNISTQQLDAAWEDLQSAVKAHGGHITEANERYLSAEFKSGIFSFVDDFEARLDSMNSQIQLRSASRVGKSDFGVNRKRVTAIKEPLEKYLKD